MPKLLGITSASGVSSTLSEVDLVIHSREILFAAQPFLFLEQLAERRSEPDKQPGQTIRFPKVNDLSFGSELTEGADMTVDDFSMSHVDLTIRQWGKAIALSEWLLQMSAYDMMSIIDRELAVNYANTSNLHFVEKIFQDTPTFIYGHGRSGRAQLTPGDVLDTEIIKDITEDFATRNVPERRDAIAGGAANFVCAAHPHTLRQLKNDPNWEKAHNYAGSTALFNGEEGMYDNVRFIKTTALPVIKHPGTYTPAAGGAPVTPAATVGHTFIGDYNVTDLLPLQFPAQTIVAGQIIYQSAFFGDRALALAESMKAELRHNGILDFGRRQEIAWLAYRGCGLLNDDRITILETRGTR